jgi:hypothetical protein
MMYRPDTSDCRIQYDGDTVVLCGAAEIVHLEADRILRRFAHSAKPYNMRLDTPEQVVLGRPSENGDQS